MKLKDWRALLEDLQFDAKNYNLARFERCKSDKKRASGSAPSIMLFNEMSGGKDNGAREGETRYGVVLTTARGD